jgi:acetyl esterase
MPLDPKAAKIVEGMRNMPSVHTLTVGEAREAVQLMTRMNRMETKPVGSEYDREISGPAGDLPVRIYIPEGTGPFPILLYFHGGGFVLCDLDSHDSLCRDFCRGAEVVVVSVGYRLAPEDKFPAASDDCLAATRWAAEHADEIDGDSRLIAVSGDSAGGNLATVTAIRIRDEGGPALSAQILLYPTTDLSCFDLPSHRENGTKGYFVTIDDMIWFQKQYVKEPSDALNPLVSPLRTLDLRGLPPALIITAEFDPLRDEGELYAGRLQEADVPTALTRYDGMIHAFLQFPMFDQAGQAMEEACKWLKKTFERTLSLPVS